MTLLSLRKLKSIVPLAILGSCLIVSSVFAEEAANDDPDELTSGVVASTGRSSAPVAVDAQTGDSVPGGESSPVSASIVKLSRGKCAVKLTNQSENSSYSVRYRVIGTEKSGRESFRRFFSSRLGPKKSSEHPFSCNDDANMRVELLSGKKSS